MEYKITKIRKYGKGVYQSEKIGTQYYNVVYAHLFTKNDTNHIHPIKVHFIHMFDGEDLWEHFNYDDEDEMIHCSMRSIGDVLYGNTPKDLAKYNEYNSSKIKCCHMLDGNTIYPAVV